MKYRMIWGPVALMAALAGPVVAQNAQAPIPVTPTNPATPAIDPTLPVTTPNQPFPDNGSGFAQPGVDPNAGFNNGSQFVPGQGFVPFDSGMNGAFAPGFVPGFGYAAGYSPYGGAYDTTPAIGGLNPGVRLAQPTTGRLPILGVNVRPMGVRVRARVVMPGDESP